MVPSSSAGGRDDRGPSDGFHTDLCAHRTSEHGIMALSRGVTSGSSGPLPTDPTLPLARAFHAPRQAASSTSPSGSPIGCTGPSSLAQHVTQRVGSERRRPYATSR